jgi:hypothetical protein
MHNTLTNVELESILNVGKTNLLKMVPSESNRHASAYKDIFDNHYQWYLVLMALSECCTNAKKRARKFDWNYNLTLYHMADIWISQQGKCAATGIIMSPFPGGVEDKNPYKISTDRVNNSGGYTKNNVRLLTHWANNAKSTWDENVFNEFVISSNNTLMESV